jgi:NTE family protein
MWQSEGLEPDSIWQVLNRQKDIQFASRADSHIARQEQIHHLRHVVRELVRLMPEAQRETPEVKEMARWGCDTFMHVVRLSAPPVDHEDHLRDIDFNSAGIHARWEAGLADTRRMLERRPWEARRPNGGRRCARFSHAEVIVGRTVRFCAAVGGRSGHRPASLSTRTRLAFRRVP